MLDKLVKCPACGGRIIISSDEAILRCPNCGEIIGIKQSEHGKAEPKMAAMKVKEASEKGSGSINVSGVFLIIILIVLFISGFTRPEFFVLFLLVLSLVLKSGAEKASDHKDKKKVEKDKINFGELTIHASARLRLLSEIKRTSQFLYRKGNVALEVEKTELSDLDDDAEREIRKTGKYFAEKYSRFSAIETEKVPFRYGSYDNETICYAAYYCTKETYYDLFIRCKTEDKYRFQSDIIDMIQTVEISEKPESLKKSLERLK